MSKEARMMEAILLDDASISMLDKGEGGEGGQVPAVGELDETAKLFQLICMYPRYVAEEKPEGADEVAFNFALYAAQAMATDDEPDYYAE